MKNFILTGAAVLAFATLPASAQAQSVSHEHGTMTDQQMGMYDSWPAERKAEYDRWPENVRVYFWSLDPDQQLGWWTLTNDQRARVYAMTPPQRIQAWAAINQQLRQRNAMNASASASGNMRWVSNPVVQPIAADQASYNGGDVPICGPNEYDNCMNAWEAGKRGPNVTKPLGYWPGHTADRRRGE